MKKIVLAFVAIFAFTSFSFGDIVTTFAPGIKDLNDLVHDSVYSWNINTPALTNGYVYTSAVINFTNIRDWTAETNVLNVNLLKDPVNLPTTITPGLTSCADFQNSTNYWASQPNTIALNTWNNLPTYGQNLSYSFDANELATLNSWATDGKFGIGIDPDCHFYNDGISLTLTAKQISVPEPGILSMIGVSLLGLGLFIRRKKSN